MADIKKDNAFGIVPIYYNNASQNPLFLVVQHQAGHWGFPKGHLEKNETPIETAKREFEEEIGITDYDIIGESSFVESYIISKEKTCWYKKKGEEVEKTVSYFLAIVKDREVTLQKAELQNFKWLPLEETLEVLTYKESKQILIAAYDFLIANDQTNKI